jgi:hypothetical protein
MKKLLFIAISSALFTLSAQAQLKVYSTGNVHIDNNNEYTMTTLAVGERFDPAVFNSYIIGVHSQRPVVSNKHTIALYGDVSSSAPVSSGRAVGVLGVAGYSTNGYNYGVMGRLTGTQGGAGIYGNINDDMGDYIGGRDAGYFNGSTYVNGTLTANSLVTPSDIRLKDNVLSLSDIDEGKTLENLLGLNVIEYSYKSRPVPEAEADTLSTSRSDLGLEEERHYGLSAQELQKIFPVLVKEGQDGYLGVNYVELVPLLIRSIQELKAELDDVRDERKIEVNSRMATNASRLEVASTVNVLYQNTPNPFREKTIIRFSLSEDVHDAFIYIFDMQGKLQKQIPITPSEQSVTLNGYELTPGMYLYSLIVNGQEMDTKRMILSK